MRLSTQRGMSLLELLVSMTIGLILLLVLFNLMTNLLTTQSADKRRALVGSVLDTAVSMMSMELRRAGYWGSTASGTNPYGNLYIENSGSCVRYAYARLPDEPSAASASRYLAFRLHDNKLQRLQTTQGNWSCSAAANLWQDMSKTDLATVQQLKFAALNTGKAIDIAVTAREPGTASQTFSRSTTVQLRNQPTVTAP